MKSSASVKEKEEPDDKSNALNQFGVSVRAVSEQVELSLTRAESCSVCEDSQVSPGCYLRKETGGWNLCWAVNLVLGECLVLFTLNKANDRTSSHNVIRVEILKTSRAPR